MDGGKRLATQGTAEPTGESAVALGTFEASTQHSVETDAATKQNVQMKEQSIETTQGEVSAREPEHQSEETAPIDVHSEAKPSNKSNRDDSTQVVKVLNPEEIGGKKVVEKEAKESIVKADGADGVKMEERKEEKKTGKNASATQAEQDPKMEKGRKLSSTTASGITVAQTGGAVSKRRDTKPASETSSGRLTQTQGSKKQGEKSKNEMDFYQRRKKKELEKCQLILTRNKQLVQVPTNREFEHREIENETWFHGYLWTGDLERMLTEDGQFLVRKSDYNGAEAYVISVMAQSEIVSLVIKQTTTKRLYWVMNYAFRSVVELIDHHYRYNEPVDEESVYLRIPVFRQDWQYSHEQIEFAHELGHGNFGTVHSGYLKRHPFDPPVKVAVKTLTLEDDNMTAAEKNEFLREANLMLAVDHPNLVKLFGLAATRMPIQIVMELCTEGLLDRLKAHYHAWMFDVKDGQMRVDEKARYVLDAARGLEYLHSCTIIHRDIAARNVLIRDGQAKISDFGLSVIGGLKKVSMKNLPTRWCAPETLSSGNYSFHTDVFSFGALIYEVFSFGKEPYADHRDELKGALRNYLVYGGQVGCKLHPIDPNTPVWIMEMIDRCRQRDCYARPLFPEIVSKLETQLGSKASSVGFFVGLRERFQRFIVDMLSIADYAAKEEEYIKCDLDWIAHHTSYEELNDDQAEAFRRQFPYIPDLRERQRLMKLQHPQE